MNATCPHCGHALPKRATTARKRAGKTRGVAFGRGPSPWFNQRAEYDENMRVKRGELVWCVLENADRFGARGGYVTPERAAELRAKHDARQEAPRSLVEIALRAEEETGEWRPATYYSFKPRVRVAA